MSAENYPIGPATGQLTLMIILDHRLFLCRMIITSPFIKSSLYTHTNSNDFFYLTVALVDKNSRAQKCPVP